MAHGPQTERVHRDPESRTPMLRAFCFENSVKQSLLHWAGGPKPVLMWLREESKHEPRNIVRDSQGHGVEFIVNKQKYPALPGDIQYYSQ